MQDGPRHASPPPFAHEAERICAAAFDGLGLRWQYEPRTFTLRVDEEGRVREAVTPDFYLPDLDLYVEVTAMSHRHVSRKNRKLRLLRELYPEIRLEVLYRRHVRALADAA